MTLLISDKINIKSKRLQETKRTLYINKSLYISRRKTIINIYTPNGRPSKYEEILRELKEEIHRSTMEETDFNTPFTIMDGTNQSEENRGLKQPRN